MSGEVQSRQTLKPTSVWLGPQYLPEATHSSTAAFGSQKRTARDPGVLVQVVWHETEV